MRQATLNMVAEENPWTLKRRDELMDMCQRFGIQQSRSSLGISLYKLQRMMTAEGMRGDEPLISIIIHESLKRQVSQRDIDTIAASFELIEPQFRKTFAIGVALISADLGRNEEAANSTILQLMVSEEDAIAKLLELPEIFKPEQWAIRLRPFLCPQTNRTIEDRLVGLAPQYGGNPSQRFLTSFAAYLKLSFDQSTMPSQVTAKPAMAEVTRTIVSHLLCAERMVYQANEGLLRMLNGWIRQNILSLDGVSKPFQAADRVKHLCPDLLNDPRNFPESWRKVLLVSRTDVEFGR